MKNVLEKTFYFCQDDNSGAHIFEHSPEDLEKDGRQLLCEEMNDANCVTEFRGAWYETFHLEMAKDRAKEEADSYARYIESEYCDDSDRNKFNYAACYESNLEDELEKEPAYEFSDGWYSCTGPDWHACGGIATVEAIIEILTRDMRDWHFLAYDLICAPESVIDAGDGECYAYITLGAYELLKECPIKFDEDDLWDIEKAVAEAKNLLNLINRLSLN